MADKILGETDNLNYCIEQAKILNNQKDIAYLESLTNSVETEQMISPRNYVRKYGGAARQIDETKDILEGILFNPEYNLLDTIKPVSYTHLSQLHYSPSLSMEQAALYRYRIFSCRVNRQLPRICWDRKLCFHHL